MLKIGSQERPEDISLYFHIPFCSRKCPYCHFFVLPDQARFKEPFLEALHREWELRHAQLAHKRVVSIYCGGGTPTKLSPSAIGGLLEKIVNTPHLTLSTDCEITLEANPEDIEIDKMRAYQAVGINRLSIGVQSFVEEELKVLERQHTAEGAIRAIHACHEAGFDNMSIDLMYELPTQTLASWEKSLGCLKGLPITHLSLYNLTIEPHTGFFKRRSQLEITLAPDEEKLAMLQTAVQHFDAVGLERYEISAFAKPGRHSLHNCGYWLGRPFLGFGPSAFSFWDKKRFSNSAHLHKYQEAVAKGDLPIGFEESLAFPHNLKELLAVQIRLCEGVDLACFERRHGQIPPEMHKSLKGLQERQWVEEDAGRWRLTDLGRLFYDSVATEII